ncbi:MAG: DinB family protein [Pyrinomonadaceae bacterium]
MHYQNIDEIYSANDRFRSDLAQAVTGLAAEELKALPSGEKWSLEQIVEHVAIVDDGMARICRKLLAEAEEKGLKSSGEILVSDVFRSYTENTDGVRLEAPERVQPSGELSVRDSQAKMIESKKLFETLRPLFGEFDGTMPKFPHPYFGPLSAQEWLVLAGEHMHRHSGQIEKLIEKIRQ